jgi:CRP-like cAMP-binding protein
MDSWSPSMVRALARIGFARGMQRADLEVLAEFGEMCSFAADELLVAPGRASAMYLVVEGVVEVVASTDKSDRRLAVLEPGSVIGEMGLLRDAAAGAGVWTTEPTRCYRLDRWAYDQLVELHPATACRLTAAIARSLAERLDRMNLWVVGLLDDGAAAPMAALRARPPKDWIV